MRWKVNIKPPTQTPAFLPKEAGFFSSFSTKPTGDTMKEQWMEEPWEDLDTPDVAPPKLEGEYAERWAKSKIDDDVGGDVSMGPGW